MLELDEPHFAEKAFHVLSPGQDRERLLDDPDRQRAGRSLACVQALQGPCPGDGCLAESLLQVTLRL